MKKYIVAVTKLMEVEFDETKFTKEFIEEFKGFMYPFNDVDDHIKFLAELEASGRIGYDKFVEGYGNIKTGFGITFTDGGVNVDIDNRIDVK